jgi:transcriptional regulator with XRE-family HTH domain
VTSIGPYLQSELFRRGLSPDEFAHRSGLGTSHIYQIIRSEKRPRQDTLDKIAVGLGMTTGNLLRAVEAQSEDDPIEQAIRQRVAEMREAVEGTPKTMWATIIRKTFDRAIDGARDMAELLSAEDSTHRASADEDRNEHGIGASKRPQRPIKPREPAFALAMLAK